MKKNIAKLLSVVMCVILCCCFPISVSAHEIYKGTTLRMQDKNSSGGPLLYVHYKYMRNSGTPDYYYDSALYAIDEWDGFANVKKGVCNQLAPTNMNISFRCSASVWSNLGLSSSTLAITWIVDTKGLNLVDSSNLKKTSGLIDLAIIYMHPTGTIFRQGTTNATTIKNRIKKTMVHEMGHAMGLGHPDRDTYSPISSSTYSIMRQGFPDKNKTGLVPQTHERNDLKSMY